MNLNNLRLITFTFACALGFPVKGESFRQGVYGMWNKGGGSVLELKEGKYRFWGATDIRSSDPPKYPQTGEYSVQGSKITLKPPRHFKDFEYRNIAGHDLLWDLKGMKEWDEKKIVGGLMLSRFGDSAAADPWKNCPKGIEIETHLRNQ